MVPLRSFLPSRLYGVACAYRGTAIDAVVVGVELGADDSLTLSLPHDHRFCLGQAITVHLDDRQGSELFSIELRVHRASYKGRVTAVEARRIRVEAVHYELYYGTRILTSYAEPGYTHPEDGRPRRSLAATDLAEVYLPDQAEEGNKLGVWITRAGDRPHTTVMAFLSDKADNVFVISRPESFKYANILRDPDCAFAIDHRSTYVFERAIDWNFSIYRMEATVVGRDNPLFAPLQARFIEKNPWELPFFSAPDITLFHLRPRGLLYADTDE